jgi:hypothetical protein
MRAQDSELPSPSVTGGEPGALYQASRRSMDNEISAGLKPSLSNAWLDTSRMMKSRNGISPYMATTKEWSKVGGTGGAATEPSTTSSNVYTGFYGKVRSNLPSTQYMLGVNSIRQTHLHEEYTPRHPFSFHQHSSQQNSTSSLLTHNHPSQQPNGALAKKDVTPERPQNGLTMLTRGIKLAHNEALAISMTKQPTPASDQPLPSSKFDRTLPTAGIASSAPPRPYRAGLAPLPSALRPHCLARDRLRLWRPLSSRSSSIGMVEMSESDLARILEVINVSWAKGTRDTYGAGLLVYHVFCDLRGIPEGERSPASPILIIAFISSCAGSYAGGTLASYVFAIRAWHILHGLAWSMDDLQVKAALVGAAVLAPPTSKRPKRAPVTVEMMERIFRKLNLQSSRRSRCKLFLNHLLFSFTHWGIHSTRTQRF